MLCERGGLTTEELRLAGVYAIIHASSGTAYIGSTGTSFRYRWDRHLQTFRGSKPFNKHLARAVAKYGEEAFYFTVLEYTSKDDAVAREQHWLDKYRSENRPLYNQRIVAASCLGTKRNAEALANMSAARRGKPLSAEHRMALSRAHKGKTLSAEHRALLSAFMKRNPRSMESKLGRAKLTPSIVRDIRESLSRGVTGRAIAILFGITETTVANIKTGRRWQWVV